MTTDAQAAKRALRKQIKTELGALHEHAVSAQSDLAQSVILDLPQYQKASRISIYLSMPTGEARTDKIVRHALDSGKQVFVPYMYLPGHSDPTSGKKRKVMDMLRLESMTDYEGLQKDAWGIPTLAEDSITRRRNAMGGTGLRLVGDKPAVETEDTEGLDLIVVPGVAFDKRMGRVGHGAGFYDSFLTRLCAKGGIRRPFLIGLCLEQQVLASDQTIPMAEWDWKVDAIAVGDGRPLTSTNSQ